MMIIIDSMRANARDVTASGFATVDAAPSMRRERFGGTIAILAAEPSACLERPARPDEIVTGRPETHDQRVRRQAFGSPVDARVVNLRPAQG